MVKLLMYTVVSQEKAKTIKMYNFIGFNHQMTIRKLLIIDNKVIKIILSIIVKKINQYNLLFYCKIFDFSLSKNWRHIFGFIYGHLHDIEMTNKFQKRKSK